ncbi:MAG: carotenoid 1,2-hydratase [Pseudomonadota bacterium]
MFSPYYALKGRRDPEDHCALNVAIYRPREAGNRRGNRWAMTERGRDSLYRTRHTLQIGPSALEWHDDGVTIRFDERSFPLPGRIRGTVRLRPQNLSLHAFALDGPRCHQWWPLAPLARVEVSLDEPGLTWRGTGYMDENFGSEPLEEGFENWNWSRATLGDNGAILYDITRRGGHRAALALNIDRHGDVGAVELPPTVTLPRTTIWRVARHMQSDDADARILRTLEDTPFYSRSLASTRLMGVRAHAMHESLALGRLRSATIKSLLPWRMPRFTRVPKGGW